MPKLPDVVLRASYFDPDRDAVVVRELAVPADVRGVVDLCRERVSSRGPLAIELTRGDELSSLLLAVTPSGAVLSWTDSLGSFFHSVGDQAAEGSVVFDYLGHYTEVPVSAAVADDVAVSAAVEYLRIGAPVHPQLIFEPD